MVNEIGHMSDLHVDSSFYKQSMMKICNYFKITEWIDSSIGQSTVLQRLEVKRPTLSNLNETQKTGGGTLILKMALISFVIQILMIPSRPFLSLFK